MIKQPCKQCGEQSVVISLEAHYCAPCWIDKFVEKGKRSDGQSNRKIFRPHREALQSSAGQSYCAS